MATEERPNNRNWLQALSQASKTHQGAVALEKVASALALLEERGIITRDEARAMLEQYGFLGSEARNE